MSRSRYGRLGLCLVSLLGLMSLMSATAFAAGAPTEVNQTAASSWGLNHVELSGGANPNGASTTITLEYRQAGTSEFKTLVSGSIGSGSKQLNINGLLTGLKPYGQYETRVKASNEFGTVYGTVRTHETPYWEISKTSLSHVAGVKSSGTATFEWNVGLYDMKISCQESGGGWIGGEWGTGSKWSTSLTNCNFYQSGKLMCKPKGTLFVDETFTANGNEVHFSFPEGCFYEEVFFQAPDPFYVTMPNFDNGYLLTQQLVLTNTLKWAYNPVKATITTNWSLTGADAGKTFGAFRAE